MNRDPFSSLKRTDQVVCAIVCAVFSIGLATHLVGIRISDRPNVPLAVFEELDPKFLVDINHAPWMELALLRGIGPTLAKRIVEFRKQHGPFANPDDLLQVRGIGRKKFDEIRQCVIADAEPTQTRQSQSTAKSSAGAE